MSRVKPSVRLRSSELLRFLVEKGLADDAACESDIGLELGSWLNVRQAIALQAIIGSADTPEPFDPMTVPRVDKVVLRKRFDLVRQALKASIMTGEAPAPGLPRIDMPASDWGSPPGRHSTFDPWRHYLKSHQRQMESVLRGLRQQLRAMLETAGKSHQLLAKLDALFENVLLERESRLLSQTVTAFEQRFNKAQRKHQAAPAEACDIDSSSPYAHENLHSLADDLRNALLAELDLRLQPVLGLIEALTQDTVQEQ